MLRSGEAALYDTSRHYTGQDSTCYHGNGGQQRSYQSSHSVYTRFFNEKGVGVIPRFGGGPTESVKYVDIF